MVVNCSHFWMLVKTGRKMSWTSRKRRDWPKKSWRSMTQQASVSLKLWLGKSLCLFSLKGTNNKQRIILHYMKSIFQNFLCDWKFWTKRYLLEGKGREEVGYKAATTNHIRGPYPVDVRSERRTEWGKKIVKDLLCNCKNIFWIILIFIIWLNLLLD